MTLFTKHRRARDFTEPERKKCDECHADQVDRHDLPQGEARDGRYHKMVAAMTSQHVKKHRDGEAREVDSVHAFECARRRQVGQAAAIEHPRECERESERRTETPRMAP